MKDHYFLSIAELTMLYWLTFWKKAALFLFFVDTQQTLKYRQCLLAPTSSSSPFSSSSSRGNGCGFYSCWARVEQDPDRACPRGWMGGNTRRQRLWKNKSDLQLREERQSTVFLRAFFEWCFQHFLLLFWLISSRLAMKGDFSPCLFLGVGVA